MKEWQKAIINAAIMAGISFLSMVIVNGEITQKTALAAAVAGGLTFLSLCSRYFKAPENDVNDDDDDNEGKSTGGGKIVGVLWL